MNIYVQIKPKGFWLPAVVLETFRDRAYNVQMRNSKIFIRKRKFIELNKKIFELGKLSYSFVASERGEGQNVT